MTNVMCSEWLAQAGGALGIGAAPAVGRAQGVWKMIQTAHQAVEAPFRDYGVALVQVRIQMLTHTALGDKCVGVGQGGVYV